MKSYQFYTEDGRGGTMLCDDDSLEEAVQELTSRFGGVVKVQYGSEVWSVDAVTNTLTEGVLANTALPDNAPEI